MSIISRRDVLVAGITLAVGVSLGAFGSPQTSILRSTAFDWDGVTVRKTAVGETRQFLRSPTATLDELELHVTTLNPGQTSHAPHQHANEELIIIREGTVEAFVLGEWKKLGPGSVIFNASNEMHAIRNVGTGPTTYHVVNWTSPGMKK
jgi:quercetin dioxygenase-like cupin family protein